MDTEGTHEVDIDKFKTLKVILGCDFVHIQFTYSEKVLTLQIKPKEGEPDKLNEGSLEPTERRNLRSTNAKNGTGEKIYIKREDLNERKSKKKSSLRRSRKRVKYGEDTTDNEDVQDIESFESPENDKSLQAETYTCSLCKRDFKTKRGLNIHTVYHMENEPFKCNECNMKFDSKSLFDDHLKDIHETKSDISVGKAFESGEELSKHTNLHEIQNSSEQMILQQTTTKCVESQNPKESNNDTKDEKSDDNISEDEEEIVNDDSKNYKNDFNEESNNHKDGEGSKLAMSTDSDEERTSDEVNISVSKSMNRRNVNKKQSKKAKKVQKYMCKICRKCFDEYQVYLLHQTQNHLGGEYMCSYCETCFKSDKELLNHGQNSECADSWRAEAEYDVGGKDESRFPKHKGKYCVVCKITFPKRQDCKDHITSKHKDGELYRCKDCSKDYFSYGQFKTHMYRVHERAWKKETCPQCGIFCFSLSTHIAVKHTDARPYKCDQCDKTFKLKGNLKGHVTYVHEMDVRPFSCSVCSAQFKAARNLKDHMKRHEDKKQYVCPHCGKRFNNQSGLFGHEKIHLNLRNHKCITCGKGFNTKADLERHEVIHTGEKPFICHVCSRGFNQHVSLKLHIMTHTGEKPHECKLCGKRFIQAGSLTQHMKTHRDISNREKAKPTLRQTEPAKGIDANIVLSSQSQKQEEAYVDNKTMHVELVPPPMSRPTNMAPAFHPYTGLRIASNDPYGHLPQTMANPDIYSVQRLEQVSLGFASSVHSISQTSGPLQGALQGGSLNGVSPVEAADGAVSQVPCPPQMLPQQQLPQSQESWS